MSAEPAGQASIELVGLLPIVAAVALGAGQLLAAGAAREAAGTAAQAGAMAVLQGGDAAGAARRAAPGWSRSRMEVAVDGRRVRVRVTPRSVLPGAAGLLVASAAADAGPAA
ncbi:MAG TPA: hypothetical protein VFT50_02490 [Baekduia sp.]|nr:hypothetical protein [Baekduia sp.]